MTELTDLSETDASNTTITTANIAEGCPPSGINNAIRNTLGLIRRAFKTSIFRLRDSTDQTKLLAFDLSGLTTATTRTLTIPDRDGSLATVSRGHIYGLTLSNNVTDVTNDIDIAAGEAASSDTAPALMVLASALTKRLDAAWAVGTGNGGLDTGTVDNETYHVHLIRRPDTGVVDVLFSRSATAPTMPANYTQRRRIGAILRLAGANLAFTQFGDYFTLAAGIQDRSSTSAASNVLVTLSTPAGIKTSPMIVNNAVQGTAGSSIIFLANGDSATAIFRAAQVTAAGEAVATAVGAGLVWTNTSRQIRYTVSVSGTLAANELTTIGWLDPRDRY